MFEPCWAHQLSPSNLQRTCNGRVFGTAKGRLSWRPFRFLKAELAQHCPFIATRDTNDHAISLGPTAFSWPTTKGILKQAETIPHRDSIHYGVSSPAPQTRFNEAPRIQRGKHE